MPKSSFAQVESGVGWKSKKQFFPLFNLSVLKMVKYERCSIRGGGNYEKSDMHVFRSHGRGFRN